MQSARILKQKIAQKQRVLGALIVDHLWLGLLEICMNAQFDYVIIDGEHVHHDGDLLSDAFALGRRADFPVLYRPGKTDAAAIRLALDLGPCGLLLPMVESARQLDEVREGMYMPPRGRRRPGGAGNRWVQSVNYAEWKSEVEDDLIILPQIESARGLEEVDAIAGHEITTHMACGPYDLSASLGVCWDPDSPKLFDALRRVREAAERRGKTLWGIAPLPLMQKLGLHFFCLTEPTLFMEAKLKELVKGVRENPPDPVVGTQK